ncbi:hypothetical protein PQR64_27055 [Paraburkholderia phytofirmans]|uniref:hypothetical protein n=1 Tax=Paraburkholderia phytofirmans TaxID=261302 RepID=UPI0038B74E47
MRSWKQAQKKEERAKIGEAGSRANNRGDANNAILPARFSDADSDYFAPIKENGRLRACANGHYRIVTAKPPNPARHSAYEADLPGGGWRDVSAAFRP